ncbi:uncharacterized protein LOC125549251 [Triticum urartu]|uniref:DUF4220 domain-containing protein n=1 Tax=Triticum urartu TaxID=4572 RepID=A0A8R7U0T9_TRIUA|nr:uncharacterized protein LOC125549251 [Triticum urartu]
MGSIMKLYYEWEIQVLVLLSFMLQMFLFFAGSLRRRGINSFLRFFTWIAYLGADLVAVYTLGYLSRHEDATTGLSFFWAPFLLIHLGGQDTITALAMEDNKLWLRHLLTLFMQVVLALYVFWKSIDKHGVELLVSDVFVFAAGIIKYGERVWSLKCGSFETLQGSTGQQYKQQVPGEVAEDPYSHIVCAVLHRMPRVFRIFTARSGDSGNVIQQTPSNWVKRMRLELGMMYDDLYTKSCVLRTRSGIILRGISQVSVLVALVLFLTSDKRRYNRADIAITWSLFVGCFLLEVCAMFILIMSPWTCAWLKMRRCGMLAKLSWFLLCSGIGWPERKPYLNSIGQYNYHRWLDAGSDQPRSYSRRAMTTVIKSLVNLVGVKEDKMLFWMSRLLDTEHVEADNETMECVVKGITDFDAEINRDPRQWPKLGGIVQELQDIREDFGGKVALVHFITEAHLRKYPLHPPSDMETDTGTSCSVLMEVCRKLSNYMAYLLVTHPSLLPLNDSALYTLEQMAHLFPHLMDEQQDSEGFFSIEPSMETLQELVDIWTKLLIYAATKSRPELHAAHLARGGELITFAWLFLSHNFLGDSEVIKVQLTNANQRGTIAYVFGNPAPR